KVYFWVQGSKDYVYFNSFGDVVKDIIVVPPNLYDFDKVLNSNESLEYIGTRLHAGIRALQKKRRSIIISVDNRAEEKKKDFNLKVIPRDMSSSDYCKIYSEEFDTKITLPNSEIEKWKTQFK
ncbi:TPA: polysaccharide pyruvyl transferase family protein, partial [Klebsiella variicola subsp. variicola]|nr:polysaccharide pyruvyl transferase family protein [Klebsiella variicola subsp. variicola]